MGNGCRIHSKKGVQSCHGLSERPERKLRPLKFSASGGASETNTTERTIVSDGSHLLCPFLPAQTANAALVCGLAVSRACFESFLHSLIDSGESVLHSKLYLQNGFTAGIQTQLLSFLIPK